MVNARILFGSAALTLILVESGFTQSSEKYIVSFRPAASQAQRAEAVRAAGASIRFNYTIIDSVAITVANPNALNGLRNNPLITAIVPDRTIRVSQQTTATPNAGPSARPGGGGGGKPGSSKQVVPAGVKRVGIPTTSSNGAGVGIAILDTGIDSTNSDLAHPAQWFSAFAAGTGDETCQDKHGHGTHVAGIAAALNNTIGVVGVAPNATPYCVKVLNAGGEGSDSDVIAGLNQVYAWNSDPSFSPKIRVINMSLGRPKDVAEDVSETAPLRKAIRNLYNTGVVTVAAAGNDPNMEVKDMIPAGYPEVFAVSSTSAVIGSGSCPGLPSIPADTASFFTTDGAFAGGIGATIAAPGEDNEVLLNFLGLCLVDTNGIVSLAVGGGTTRKSGTSMASPHVAGVVARFIQTEGVPNSGSGVETLRSRVRNTADRITIAPLDSPTLEYTFDGVREGIAKAP